MLRADVAAEMSRKGAHKDHEMMVERTLRHIENCIVAVTANGSWDVDVILTEAAPPIVLHDVIARLCDLGYSPSLRGRMLSISWRILGEPPDPRAK